MRGTKSKVSVYRRPPAIRYSIAMQGIWSVEQWIFTVHVYSLGQRLVASGGGF